MFHDKSELVGRGLQLVLQYMVMSHLHAYSCAYGKECEVYCLGTIPMHVATQNMDRLLPSQSPLAYTGLFMIFNEPAKTNDNIQARVD